MTKLKDLSKVLQQQLNEVRKELTKPSTMKKIGEELRDDVVKRTRLGYGADKDGGQRQKLDPLSKSYVDQRKGKLAFWTNDNGKVIPVTSGSDAKSRKARRNEKVRNQEYIKSVTPRLDSTTRPSKSNLTRTGDMLDKVGVIAGIGKVIIGFKTSKAAKKAAFVSRRRPFMFATKQQITRLTRSVRKLTDEILANKIKF